MSKIVAIDGKFRNLKAFLAHIAEDETAVGFCGAIRRVRADGDYHFSIVSLDVTRRDLAYIGACLTEEAMRDD